MKDLRNYLKPNEVERLLDLAENTRDYLMIRVLWKTGMRVSELINMEESWIDYEERMLTIFGKGSKWRRAPVDRESLMLIKQFIRDNKSTNQKIFPISRVRVFQILRGISDKADIDKNIHPHTLRHSYAVNYLKKGGNLRNLQMNLGHSDLNITAQYLQVTAQDRKEEYEKIISVD